MIKYRAGYKYQLAEDYRELLSFQPDAFDVINTEYITLDECGFLTIKAGYAWDGPSGPTLDTKNFMRGSLVHDALYQLIRTELLPKSFREKADQELKKICLEDGMSKIRAWWVYRAVRKFADDAARPSSEKPVMMAP